MMKNYGGAVYGISWRTTSFCGGVSNTPVARIDDENHLVAIVWRHEDGLDLNDKDAILRLTMVSD